MILLAKEPVAGSVKTRLAATIGDAAACRCHEAFVRDSLAGLATLGDFDVALAVTPAAAAPRLRSLAAEAGIGVLDQGGGDLGERMERLVTEAFSAPRGPEGEPGSQGSQGSEGPQGPVLLLGADTPDLPWGLLREAVTALEFADVALGPADDGGYYLVAVRCVLPELFRIDAPWGSEAVFAATERRLRAAGRRLALLERWSDIDRIDDLRRFERRLRSDPGLAQRCVHSAKVLAELIAELPVDFWSEAGAP